MENDQLYHWGIKGMKWGQRRFQNKDGSLTPAGRARYSEAGEDSDKANKSPDSDSPPPKTRATMTNEELRDAITNLQLQKQHKQLSYEVDDGNDDLRGSIARLQLEKQYKQLYNELNPPQVSKGKQIADKILKDAVMPAASAAVTNLAKEAANQLGKKYLGVDDAGERLKKEAESLKREAENAVNRRKIAQVEDFMKERKRKADEERAAKEAEKQAEKEAKQAEKQAEKEAKQAEKQAAKEAKQAEKQAEKEAKQAEKQAARDAENVNRGRDYVIDAEWSEVTVNEISPSRVETGSNFAYELWGIDK